MTPEDIARKIVGNPNGYTTDSVTLAREFIDLVGVLEHHKRELDRVTRLAAHHATKRIEAEQPSAPNGDTP